jgi:cytochrome P450
MSGRNIPDFNEDLFTDESIRAPYEQYRCIRDLGPVVRYVPGDCYVVGRFEDVRRILRDAETFISGKGVAMNREMNERLTDSVLTTDSSRHDFLRKTEGEPLTPGAIKELTGQVEREAGLLIERIMSGSRRIDAMPAIAQYLPLTIVTDLIGLPEEGRENMLTWAAAGFQLNGPFNERAQVGLSVMTGMFDYMFNKVEQATVKPGSWAWQAFNLIDGGQITAQAVARMLIDIVFPSLDTTILATGNLLMLLGRHPDQWNAMKADPSLVPNAVNEALRLESPVRCFTRYVAKDADIGGAPVPAGSRVLILYGSANRDERYWKDAERFDVKRPNAVTHLAFGSGKHMCLGAHLARLEIHSLMKSMLSRIERFEIGEPIFVLNNTLRGLSSLQMTLH